MNIIKNLFGNKSKLEILQELLKIEYSRILDNLEPVKDDAYFTEECMKDIYMRDIEVIKVLKSEFIFNYFDEINIIIQKKSYNETQILDPFLDLNSKIDITLYVRNLDPTEKDFLDLWKLFFENFGHRDIKYDKLELDSVMNSDRQIFADWHFDSTGNLVSNQYKTWCTFRFITSINIKNNIYKRPVLMIKNFNLFIKILENLRDSQNSFTYRLSKNSPFILWEDENDN
jgi:hypothetical protein